MTEQAIQEWREEAERRLAKMAEHTDEYCQEAFDRDSAALLAHLRSHPGAADARDAARYRKLMALQGARRRIWNHVLDDEEKAGHETIESVLDAAMRAAPSAESEQPQQPETEAAKHYKQLISDYIDASQQPDKDHLAAPCGVTKEQALAALDDMDDFARMQTGVDAIGARETLIRFIEQKSAAPSPDAKASAAPASVGQEPDAVVEPIGNGDAEAVLLKPLPVGTKLYTRPSPDALKLIGWGRETAGGFQVCYMQVEPPTDMPWPGMPDIPWIPLYTRAPDAPSELRESHRELMWALASILPMAKGYAHAHPVGANDEKVTAAEDALTRAKEVQPC
jgi:hypothetical protein